MSLWFWQQFRAQRLGGSGRRLRGWAGSVRQGRGKEKLSWKQRREQRGEGCRGSERRWDAGPCRRVSPRKEGLPVPGGLSWGLDSKDPTCAPGQSWRTAASSPRVGGTAPLGREGPWTLAEMPHGMPPYSLLVWVWGGQTDRQRCLVAGCCLLVEGHREWKYICCD